MKLQISIKPEGEETGITFAVEVPQKHLDIAKESLNLIAAVSSAVKNIRSQLKEK